MGQEEHPDSPAPHAPHTPAPVSHLVVSHADVGPDVVVGDDLLLALRLGKANRGRDVGGRSGGLPGQQQGQPLWLCHPLPPCPLLPGAPAGSEPPVSRWPPGRSGRRQHSAPARGGEGSGLGGVATFLGGRRQRSLGAGVASAHGHQGRWELSFQVCSCHQRVPPCLHFPPWHLFLTQNSLFTGEQMPLNAQGCALRLPRRQPAGAAQDVLLVVSPGSSWAGLSQPRLKPLRP